VQSESSQDTTNGAFPEPTLPLYNYFSIILPSVPDFETVLVPMGFPIIILYSLPMHSMSALRLALLIIFNIVVLITFDKDCQLQMSQLKSQLFLDMVPDQLINIYGFSGECFFHLRDQSNIPLDCLNLANGSGKLL
jgi:hypothetical protein